MPDSNPALDDSAHSASDELNKVGIHHDFISATTKSVPPHLIKYLNNHTFNLPDWFSRATPQQRKNLEYAQRINDYSFTSVSAYLEQISTVEDFAVPLLEQALTDTFGISCDVRQNIIEITKLNWFTDEVESSTIQTLLQAALHNFDARQAVAGGIPRRSNLWNYRTQSARDPAPTRIDIEPVAFARLCRELDIGGRYQTHLDSLFNPSDAARKTELDQSFLQHERTTMMLQAAIALMKGDISESTYATLINYCRGHDMPLFNSLPMTFNSMAIDDIPFTSMILAHGTPIEQNTRCIMYIPGDPISCIKEYPRIQDAAADLLIKLHNKNYRDFFIHLAPQRKKLKLKKRLNRHFIDGKRDPLNLQPAPVQGNLFNYLYA